MTDMSKQTEADRLANQLDYHREYDLGVTHTGIDEQAAAELRRQQAEIERLNEALAEQPAPMIRGDIRDGLVDDEPAQQEPVAWISVKDALPKAVRGVSYNASLTDVVLVRHSDRPDYPITAHAVVGEGLGAGIAIPTEGASEHPEIAWYSASSNLNNPFDLKNDDYDRYLPKVFGSKITHWKPIDTSPPAQRTWVHATPWRGLTDEEIDAIYSANGGTRTRRQIYQAIEAKLREKNT